MGPSAVPAPVRGEGAGGPGTDHCSARRFRHLGLRESPGGSPSSGSSLLAAPLPPGLPAPTPGPGVGGAGLTLHSPSLSLLISKVGTRQPSCLPPGARGDRTLPSPRGAPASPVPSHIGHPGHEDFSLQQLSSVSPALWPTLRAGPCGCGRPPRAPSPKHQSGKSSRQPRHGGVQESSSAEVTRGPRQPVGSPLLSAWGPTAWGSSHCPCTWFPIHGCGHSPAGSLGQQAGPPEATLQCGLPAVSTGGRQRPCARGEGAGLSR